ncbi:hypothetical protein FACS1894205_5920 [Alphaproteobacteria bacterium]|nr:hypothetical protein FACS1894205_5920 [Alphaproteobacteria bacterium]
MRILELSGDTGSTEAIAKNLAKCLTGKGHDVHIIAPVRRRWAASVVGHVFRTKPDIIHAHLGDASILAGRIGRFFGIPVLTTLHGFQKIRHYRNVRNFTAVSHAVKKHFEKQGIPGESICVIHNGFDPALFFPTPRERKAATDRIVLGTAGTLTSIKQHQMLIDAIRILIGRRPQILLKIAGVGPLLETLTQHIKVLGLQNHVELVGFQKDVAAFYSKLDMYVQASAREGFCLPLLEAMACGLPVATTPSEGPEEYIDSGENGVIAQESTPDALAAAIMPIIDDPDRAAHMGGVASRSVASMTWKNRAADYESLMVGLCKKA